MPVSRRAFLEQEKGCVCGPGTLRKSEAEYGKTKGRPGRAALFHAQEEAVQADWSVSVSFFFVAEMLSVCTLLRSV